MARYSDRTVQVVLRNGTTRIYEFNFVDLQTKELWVREPGQPGVPGASNASTSIPLLEILGVYMADPRNPGAFQRNNMMNDWTR